MLWLREIFVPWLDSQPADYKIFIAGNHDFVFENLSIAAVYRDLGLYSTSIDYLNDSSLTIDGIEFYGSPWTKWFWDWAFNLPKFDLDGRHGTEHWARIPETTNVLLTHGPPSNIRDWNHHGNHCGDYELKQRVFDERLSALKLHVFGHIHEGFGTEVINGKTFCNAAYGGTPKNSYLSEGKRPAIAPIVEIDFD